MMRKALLCLGLVFACSKPMTSKERPETKEKTMEVSGTVLDLIPRLTARLPFRQEEVAKVTGTTLQRDSQISNAAYDVYKSVAAQKDLSSVEVRQRADGGTDKDGIVILDLAAGGCVTQAQAMARFGQNPDELLPPSPHGPPDAPTYVVYKQRWGVLRLGFATSGRECLTTIVLDATGS